MSPEPLPESPCGQLLFPRKRMQVSLQRHLSSPSAKRKSDISENCAFCNRRLEGKYFSEHLETNEICKTQYCRLYKVNTVEEIITKIYSCIFCFQTNRVRRINFRNHLIKNKKCFEKYCNKYRLDTIESVCSKVLKVRKSIVPSRTKSARKLEYKKKKEKNFKTQTESYNDYKNSTILSNYKFCCKCKSNFNDYSAEEIKDDQEIFEDLELNKPENKHFRRNQKYFICNSCLNEDIGKQNADHNEEIIKLSEIVYDGNILLFPSLDANGVIDDIVYHKHVKVMFPNSLDATEFIPVNRKLRSRNKEVHKIYKTDLLRRENITSAYENELHKYQVQAERGDLFTADNIDFENKKLSKVEKMPMDLYIAGSQAWLNKQKAEMGFRKDLYGSVFLTVEINLPKYTLENVATSLIQEGYVVTVEKIESAAGELKHSYIVHADHKSSEDCSLDSCLNKMSLQAFIESRGFDVHSLGNKYVGTHVSSVHQKLKSFATHLIKAPSSGISSENFQTKLVFDLDGDARIVALIWPKELEKINLSVAANYGKIILKADLIDFVQRNISVSSDKRILRSTFMMSDKEAEELAEIVRTHQQHLCDKGMECRLCLKVELPSLETILTEAGPQLNMTNSKTLKKLWKGSLVHLSLEEKDNCSTYEWLDRLTGEMVGEIDDDNKYFKLIYNNQEFVFEIDRNVETFLNEYASSPLTGIYHYILSCSEGSDEGSIVLKRLKIVDCFTTPFNPLLLKASDAKINVHIGNSLHLVENLIMRLEKNVSQRGEIRNLNLALSHSEISFAEAISLFDKTKSQVLNSSPVSYVNAKSQRLVCFKKATQESLDNFKLNNSAESYTMLKNIISRHFSRLNGGKMVLAETASWYTYAGAEKSKELFDIYKDSIEKVPLSEVECIDGHGEFLPTFLICQDGDVLKKCSKQKVLTYPLPKTNFEIMYSRLLLFSPLKSEEELYENNLHDMYHKLNDEGDDTIIRTNERRLFPMKILRPNSVNVVAEHEDVENVEEMNAGDVALDALLDVLEEEVD